MSVSGIGNYALLKVLERKLFEVLHMQRSLCEFHIVISLR